MCIQVHGHAERMVMTPTTTIHMGSQSTWILRNMWIYGALKTHPPRPGQNFKVCQGVTRVLMQSRSFVPHTVYINTQMFAFWRQYQSCQTLAMNFELIMGVTQRLETAGHIHTLYALAHTVVHTRRRDTSRNGTSPRNLMQRGMVSAYLHCNGRSTTTNTRND